MPLYTFLHNLLTVLVKKNKANLLTERGGLQGCEVTIPDFLENWLTDDSQVVSTKPVLHNLPDCLLILFLLDAV
jgi:hypothetical protein